MHPAFNVPELSITKEEHEINPEPLISKDENDKTTRQIRYFQDRIDFHGEILMKPQGAKSRNLFFLIIY
jgi:hypothetical protein